MITLFKRSGQEFTGQVLRDEKGKPFYSYIGLCGRCGGAGGAEQWRHTGWKCYDCGGSGKGKQRSEPLYTKEQLVKLDAALAKRQATARAKAEAAAAARQAEVDARRAAFLAQHGDLLETARATGDVFAADIVKTCEQNCSISDRQIEVLKKAIARSEERAASKHIGSIGERVKIKVKIDRVIDITVREPGGYARFGTRYMTLARDESGNAVVYRGNIIGEKDDTITVKATVAEHTEYQGMKQTIVKRPKVAS